MNDLVQIAMITAIGPTLVGVAALATSWRARRESTVQFKRTTDEVWEMTGILLNSTWLILEKLNIATRETVAAENRGAVVDLTDARVLAELRAFTAAVEAARPLHRREPHHKM